MNKYQQYEIEKQKLQRICKTSDEYEEEIKRIVEKLESEVE